ncbi:hypothetical protein [Streptomyces hundungensis]|uniref:hypothetical protein n=1 Tax=Streptomyces hundungensis TaxID=1077946 RepID=UPI0013C48327|nr:hypothetical protein [Streptomyces hundungensis]
MGRVKGALRASFLPSLVVIVAIAPSPPPENTVLDGTTAGVTVPSATACSVVSMFCHVPSVV